MMNDATGEHSGGSELPPPPIGEAAALVARLLSGSDPHTAVREEDHARSSMAAPEPVPTESRPVSTVFSEPFSRLLADRNVSAIPAPPNAGPRLPRSRTTISLMIVALVVLTFGAGLAVGYGVLGLRSKAARKSSAQETASPATTNAALSQTVDNPASTPNTANSTSLASTVNSPESTAPPPPRSQREAFANSGSANDFQSPSAQPRNVQSGQPQAASEPRLAPQDSSAFGNGSESTNPSFDSSATATGHRVTPPVFPQSQSGSTTQAIPASAQTVHPDSASIDSASSANALTLADAQNASETTALPVVISPREQEPSVVSDNSTDPGPLLLPSPGQDRSLPTHSLGSACLS